MGTTKGVRPKISSLHTWFSSLPKSCLWNSVCYPACAGQTDMQMKVEIPRWWDPGSKGSLSGIRSERRRHHQRGCRRGLVASPRWAQGEGLGAGWWHGDWGVRRNKRTRRARRGSTETKSSAVTWAGWGRSPPGRGDWVRPVALGDGHGGRRRDERVSWSNSSRWAWGNNELGGRGCRW